MGRTKTVSDETLLDRLLGAIHDSGPGELTFSNASKAAGLATATLVQRFGTRDAMIEAAMLHAWDKLEAATAAADSEVPENAAGAVALLMRLMPVHAAPYNVTDGLSLLREDMRNPALRERGRAWGDYLAMALGRRLTDQTDIARKLGWQMASVWQGALIWWGFTRDTKSEIQIQAMLEDWCRTASRNV
ncbi:TetR/AcrR family transcriptional regulator [Roseiarcaceae bacterium H3SJ34-1]|uniref:TetR/AcrR family transcriptional regulator n=1 Tax=Terripilifer ovatus TaxID=3032367 RepID=UPI003AB96E20|nr:TetR/AcrR family transcriptional regulator [Roseiarcaceae bacterium H3SJ34-1]